MAKAGKHFLKRGDQRRRLGLIAVKHLVVDRQAFGGLHHPEHELAGNQALLGHAVTAHVAVLLTQACGPNGGEVVEHQRHVLIHQRADLLRHQIVDRLLMVYQRIQAAQQMLVGQRFNIHLGNADRLQPSQHAQLGVGVAEAIEDHDANRVLNGRGVARAAKHASQCVKAEFFPELIERPHVAQRQCGFKRHLRGLGHRSWHPLGAKQTLQQRIDLATRFVQTPQRGNGALARTPCLVAKRFDQLHVGVAARSGELGEHAKSVATGKTECNNNCQHIQYNKLPVQRI